MKKNKLSYKVQLKAITLKNKKKNPPQYRANVISPNRAPVIVLLKPGELVVQ